jgi:GAF domain-containing protein
MSLKQLLNEHRNAIVSRFVRDVERKDLPPENVPRSVLVDHIPTFLDELGRALSQDGSSLGGEEREMIDTAREHGVQRWEAGYDLSAVVREYGVLRHAILEVARDASIPISGEDAEALANYLNLGVASATDEYVRSREDQLRARQSDLEFICEAGESLSSSLDYQSILARLTRLVVPRLADICIVHLDGCSVEDMPIAHANPTKVALVREILRRYPWPRGAHGHSEVVRTNKSVLVSSLARGSLEQIAHTPEQLEMLRELGVCSWLAAPLQVKSSIFGTITLAWSDSGRHYTEADLLLVNDLARRAASAIDNAHLYELARTERARAEAAARAKDEFVAVVSHELRTPLNVIIGWVRLLKGGALSEATREHALEVVERNADAQNQLVTDLLDISRMLTGKLRLVPAQVDLGNLMRLVVEDARLALDAKRLKMHLSITEPAVMLGATQASRLESVAQRDQVHAKGRLDQDRPQPGRLGPGAERPRRWRRYCARRAAAHLSQFSSGELDHSSAWRSGHRPIDHQAPRRSSWWIDCRSERRCGQRQRVSRALAAQSRDLDDSGRDEGADHHI